MVSLFGVTFTRGSTVHTIVFVTESTTCVCVCVCVCVQSTQLWRFQSSFFFLTKRLRILLY